MQLRRGLAAQEKADHLCALIFQDVRSHVVYLHGELPVLTKDIRSTDMHFYKVKFPVFCDVTSPQFLS